ncbi:MAG: nucleoside triphosphate pyrophosphohydrolase [Geminocystis sp.]|nr:nucleoside triphosphate pyrophosphohydrolase [Geminocystis sp.]HIK37565.1 nucleoside triphosphate pyrophosphohydrolase [Geminocystis sp. M7585_C2015_104]MCS7146719.1 nucleoside triphosphate pyrophosphohydrolase [Geminocystis sp.]MCX8077131.1 nucleoside triphosphate pyrophosphohydrolase [Geminocystis sp.]MDW8115545.1 nucleoside triphosphate pyrophosphohydrolase [Geminocystis sp.]
MSPTQNHNNTLQALSELIEVVAKLRHPEKGCPWDLAQTQTSLIPYILEEAYETVHAIQSGNQREIAEELGDLLLQVVLQAQIAQENGHFTLEDVARGITEKLIRRHPHVFGDVKVADAQQVRHNWEKIKQEEEGENSSLTAKLKKYVSSLPPLMASFKISQKAAQVGFEWENIEGVWQKFYEELEEFKQACASGDKTHATAELGDLLFVIVNLARWYGIDPTVALQETNQRFLQRFYLVEKMSNRPLPDYSLAELEQLWQQAKKILQSQQG